jgi:prophage antirepressor-like protein
MNELTIFSFEEGREVRTMLIDGDPWWVNVDVCAILGIENPRDAIANFPENERMTVASSYGHSGQRGGAQSLNLVNEPGLYRLIFQSRKPEAERFKTWVFTEVLPAIRKTGTYSILKRDYESLQNVYHQNENYRMKYISLLDKLEERGMKIREIWELSGVDRSFLIEYRQKMIADKKAYREGGEWGRETAPKQAPGGTTPPPEAPQEGEKGINPIHNKNRE